MPHDFSNISFLICKKIIGRTGWISESIALRTVPGTEWGLKKCLLDCLLRTLSYHCHQAWCWPITQTANLVGPVCQILQILTFKALSSFSLLSESKRSEWHRKCFPLKFKRDSEKGSREECELNPQRVHMWEILFMPKDFIFSFSWKGGQINSPD